MGESWCGGYNSCRTGDGVKDWHDRLPRHVVQQLTFVSRPSVHQAHFMILQKPLRTQKLNDHTLVNYYKT